MINLSQIQTDLVTAMKAKDHVAVEVLRGLKTRIQNEQVAKTARELNEDEIIILIWSEVKRRKEAAESFEKGGRQELKAKELLEAEILQKYLPAQMPENQIAEMAEKVIAEGSFKTADFGKAMGIMKSKLGNSADGATIAKVLKEKLTKQ